MLAICIITILGMESKFPLNPLCDHAIQYTHLVLGIEWTAGSTCISCVISKSVCCRDNATAPLPVTGQECLKWAIYNEALVLGVTRGQAGFW